jgi:hypothetical protein
MGNTRVKREFYVSLRHSTVGSGQAIEHDIAVMAQSQDKLPLSLVSGMWISVELAKVTTLTIVTSNNQGLFQKDPTRHIVLHPEAILSDMGLPVVYRLAKPQCYHIQTGPRGRRSTAISPEEYTATK